jgi:hypothetical protein
MSNLSELLPTGGGQNSVDFVATGTLASGQAVALKADGTVEAITGVAEGAGTPSVFEAASSTYISSTFDSVNNKVVIVYSATSAAGYAVVGTVSGTSISFGTPVVFASGSPGIYWQNVVFDSNAQKVAIAYYGNGPGYAIVGTVSGTSISFGSPAQFNNQYVSYISLAFDSTNNKVIIAYRDQNNSDYGTAIVATVSGTSISFGTKAIFNSAGTPWISAVYDSTNNKIVIAYQDYDGISDYGTAIVGTVSGTSISFGTAATYESDASYISAIFDSTNNKIVISYRAAASSNYGKSAVGTVSGTSISFGTPVVFQSASTYYTSAVYDPTNNKVVIAYRNIGNSSYGTSVVGTVSGTSISFGAAAVFESAQSNYISATYDSTNNKVVIAYQDSGNSGYGTGIVFTVGSSNNTSFIGITAEAISSAATGPVNVYGGINAVQTGLTIASDYYVQADGSLSTTSTSPAIKVGQAVSATTINMKDLT